MSEDATPVNVPVPGSAKTWCGLAVVAAGVSGISFLGGAAALLFPLPPLPRSMPLYVPALGILAAVAGGLGIFAFNGYARLKAESIAVTFGTNLLGRLLALIQLLSLAAVLGWLIIHFIGLPALGHPVH
ncbi:MAG: hypothetical protein ACP5I8_11360 [Phycisphaerae bacterium]